MLKSGVLSHIHICDEEILIRHSFKAMERFLAVHDKAEQADDGAETGAGSSGAE
jgi:hypothetical protein